MRLMFTFKVSQLKQTSIRTSVPGGHEKSPSTNLFIMMFSNQLNFIGTDCDKRIICHQVVR